MQAMSQKQPVDLSSRSECPQSAFIKVVNDEELFVPPSSPELIGHTTVQHVDDSNFVIDPEPVRTPAPLLTNDLDEDNSTSHSDDNSLPFPGDPKHVLW